MIQDHKIAKMFPKWRKGKTGKYKKKGKKVSHTLTQDDVEFLKKNTRYDEQEIKEWYRWVQKYALRTQRWQLHNISHLPTIFIRYSVSNRGYLKMTFDELEACK